ncbi:Hypothetical predicted protein [Pelobates cultripes]|uniref:Uncharacterized protein n=1 Tax=Pelobates cultripes TaxID=61616 RepID=A0AAD1WMG8_PELCU|nr:Hypothetical predicted protein [Pelobates cultripes]
MRPQRRQKSFQRNNVPTYRGSPTRSHIHSSWTKEQPLQPHYLPKQRTSDQRSTSLHPENMSEHCIAVQKDASHRNTKEGLKPSGSTEQSALHGHSKYILLIPETGIG